MLCPICRSEGAWKSKTMSVPEPCLLFCSEKCLLSYITSMPPLGEDDLRRLGVRVAPAGRTDRDYPSIVLRNSFRSWFEGMIAEHIVLQWKIRAQYEPHAIQLGPRRWYIPDFWLPDFGLWLEAKGEWRGGGKKKFVEALHVIGEGRLLLIPDFYKRWFVKIKEW